MIFEKIRIPDLNGVLSNRKIKLKPCLLLIMECRHEEIKLNMGTGVKYCLVCGKEFFEDEPV